MKSHYYILLTSYHVRILNGTSVYLVILCDRFKYTTSIQLSLRLLCDCTLRHVDTLSIIIRNL